MRPIVTGFWGLSIPDGVPCPAVLKIISVSQNPTVIGPSIQPFQAVMANGLRKLGVELQEYADGIDIKGGKVSGGFVK